MAIVETPKQIQHYSQFNFTSLMVTNLSRKNYPKELLGYAKEQKLGYHWFYRWKPKHKNKFLEDFKKIKTEYPGLLGISVGDETNEKYFKELGYLIKEAKKIDSNILYYHALFGLDLPAFAKDLKLGYSQANLFSNEVIIAPIGVKSSV